MNATMINLIILVPLVIWGFYELSKINSDSKPTKKN